ncbi:aspartate-semialdehyde dehydrogenase, partial [mine drainage metagenome]
MRLLEDHPFFQLDGLYGSQVSSGTKLSIGKEGRVLEIHKSDAEEITKKKFDFIFSAVSEQTATSLERELRSMNNRIVTNASGNRVLPDVPIVVLEVNYQEISGLDKRGYIVANGNCSTIGLVLGLAPLR